MTELHEEQDEEGLSPEAAAYLKDLRELPFEDFRKKHAIDVNVNSSRAQAARRSERGRRR